MRESDFEGGSSCHPGRYLEPESAGIRERHALREPEEAAGEGGMQARSPRSGSRELDHAHTGPGTLASSATPPLSSPACLSPCKALKSKGHFRTGDKA